MFNYKSLTKEQLIDAFSDHHFKVQPRWHQYVSLAFVLGENLNRVNYLHDVGTGKTITSLLTCQLWGCKKILVVAPESSFISWEKGIKLATDFTFEYITGKTQVRKQKIQKDDNISIITYEALKTVFCEYIHGESKSKWEIDYNAFEVEYDCVIFDEIHNCKNNSLQTAICRYLSALTRHTIGLTGTPVDKCLLELFYIYLVLDGGATLGNNYFAYRNRYFYECYYDWKIKQGMSDVILNQIKENSISFDRSECFDLPEKTEMPLFIQPTDEFLNYQRQLLTQETFTYTGVEYPITKNFKVQKLVQLASGFMYLKDNDLILKKNAKLDLLNELLDEIKDKIIIVFKFTQERDLIIKELKRHKTSYLVLDGHTEDKEFVKREFVNNEEVKVLLLYPKCGKEGFDATVCSNMLFFSPIVSPTILKQCKGRINRDGQKKNCLFIEFVLEHSVETTVYKNKDKALELVDSVMEFIKGYKNER